MARNHSRPIGLRRILGLALALLGVTAPARAGIVFQEDFSGATPGGGYTGVIPGTKFQVTSRNVDIIGVLNGSFFASVANPNGNALDLVGASSGGSIASIPTIDLAAGTTYTITFQYILQGFDPTSTAISLFTVGLGSYSQQLTAIPQVESASLTFTPSSDEAGAILTFATDIAPDGVHGAVLSDIVVTAGAVPEPSSLWLAGTGLVAVLGYVRIRRRQGA